MRLGFSVIAWLPLAALASEKTYKYDQYAASLTTAASQLNGTPISVQAGYETGEAFGQIYKPSPDDYPVNVLGIDLVMVDPPNQPGGTAEATIELYFGEGNGPAPPNAQPDFVINTEDLFNQTTMSYGMPLVGNSAMSITFDQENEANHPPLIYSGNIWVMIRFKSEATSMGAAWGVVTCDQEFMGVQIGCGCQPVATAHDQATTTGVNILHFAKACDLTATQWAFMENIGVTGDLIMRLRADVAASPSTGNTGNSGNGGNSGNDDPSGGVDDPETDDTPQTTEDDGPALTIGSVSPPTAYADEHTNILIAGAGFQTGVRVLVGTTEISVNGLTGDGLILATVIPGLRAGMYTVAVINPDTSTAYLSNAMEILARPAADGGCAAMPPSAGALVALLWWLRLRRRKFGDT